MAIPPVVYGPWLWHFIGENADEPDGIWMDSGDTPGSDDWCF